MPLPGLSFVLWLIHAIQFGIDCMLQATKASSPPLLPGSHPAGAALFRVPLNGRATKRARKALQRRRVALEWRRLTTP